MMVSIYIFLAHDFWWSSRELQLVERIFGRKVFWHLQRLASER